MRLSTSTSRFLLACLLFITTHAISGISTAAVITSSVTAHDDDRWTYVYTAAAEAGELEIKEFSIFFDYSRFANLTVVSPGAGWDVIAIAPDLNLMSNGYIDALALDTGIGPGTSTAGFAVSFTFLGSGPIGEQAFDIIDPDTFLVISSGQTQFQGVVSAVPEPSSAALLGLGFTAWFMLRAARTRRASSSPAHSA